MKQALRRFRLSPQQPRTCGHMRPIDATEQTGRPDQTSLPSPRFLPPRLASLATSAVHALTRGCLHLSLLAAAIVSLALAGEAVLRVYYFTSEGLPLTQWPQYLVGHYWTSTFDNDWGWKATDNYHLVRQQHTAEGTPYTVTLSQDAHGFRQFGKLDSTKIRIFVLGDSFTHAREASDGKAYYAILGQRLDAEVFAYGVENYGTLQELMVLDRYVEWIQPTVIIWQFCSNEVVNNDPDLDGRTTVHNALRERPYWINGAVRHILPQKTLTGLRRWAFRYSKFLIFVLSRLDRLRLKYSRPTLEEQIQEQGLAHQGFARAVQITEALLQREVRRARGVPIVAFNCTDEDPYTQQFREMSQRLGIFFIDDVARTIREQHATGADLYHADHAHWNETGHHIAGDVLSRAVQPLVRDLHPKP
jgi:hypothetical protein